VLAAALGYGLTMLFWRYWVRHAWHKRQQERRARQP
jgi:uncharacterized protein